MRPRQQIKVQIDRFDDIGSRYFTTNLPNHCSIQTETKTFCVFQENSSLLQLGIQISKRLRRQRKFTISDFLSWKRRQENTKRRIASIKLLSPSSEEIFEKKIFLSHYCTIICCNKVLLTSHNKTFTQMSSFMQFEPSFLEYLSKHF